MTSPNNPYESSTICISQEHDSEIRRIVLASLIYILSAFAASWVGTAFFVGANMVFFVWGMQSFSDHLLQTTFFLAGSIGSFFVIRQLIKPSGLSVLLLLSALSGAAFGAMPYAFEPVIEMVPMSIFPNAGRWFDSIPLTITSIFFFVVTTSSILVTVWTVRAIAMLLRSRR
ncbi:hypothetical protein [Rhodopirellula sp. MGV]|uniref:hypothetical protein n=1 Tax=Rhodopirellula sp. MGV TaxID=2023130 RepID=UPI000B972ACF|nr:hypothetical protein [Rhodopirellula sp. MGV]OYP37680.1 hypothetical protein CGZ80_04120 [Rhodopirellula sp. MGV]PNY37118.1 hypothetical protein C2E31_08975 [Rhodopirellula baltica]